MAGYIERETLYELLKDEDRCGYLDRLDIASVTAADVAPVRHGKWIENYGAPNVKRCSVCKTERWAKDSWWRYCPNCGAKMRGENNE